jgi:hypothetical protein
LEPRVLDSRARARPPPPPLHRVVKTPHSVAILLVYRAPPWR